MSLPNELAPRELALEQDVESHHDDDGVVGSTSMPIESSGKDCGGLSGHSDDCHNPFSEVLSEL